MAIQRYFAQTTRKVCKVFLSVLSLVTLLGCSAVTGSSSVIEDTTYLTPIPQETLQAYKLGTPIRDKLQAVIAARIQLNNPPHFKSSGVPKVVSVDETILDEAHKRVAQSGSYSGENSAGNTKVWLVIFEGDWQATPPDPSHTMTPPPPFHGCSYVIVNADGKSGIEIGGIDCKS